jgi:hypothetical protein
MSFHGKKILPPFNWTKLDPPLQTKILQDATRRFVMESEGITLCFECPMHPKLLLFPAQLIITYKNSKGDNVDYKWKNVSQIKFYRPDTSSGTQGWCNNAHMLQIQFLSCIYQCCMLCMGHRHLQCNQMCTNNLFLMYLQ